MRREPGMFAAGNPIRQMSQLSGLRSPGERTVRLSDHGVRENPGPTTHDANFILDRVPCQDTAGRVLGSFVLPIGIAGLFAILADNIHGMPEMLSALLPQAPYFALGAALVFSVAFKRGRVLFAGLALMIAYGAFRYLFESGHDAFAARTIYLAVCVFVPLNLAFLSMLRERGAMNSYGSRRLALLVIEVGIAVVIVQGGHREIVEAAYRPLIPQAGLAGSPVPQIALGIMAIGLVVAVAGAAIRGSAVVEAALAVVILVFAAACNGVPDQEVFVWLTAAGTIMTAAVMQDSYRMAFSDELTGLPGRRVLNETLMGLDRNYTIAMLDVDHFKAFNDTWGHDIGDQVLKLVATRLRRVGGGGKAYRYGGEEFTVLYPGRRVSEVLAHLEALRKDIEGYKLKIRRRASVREDGQAASWVSVTVSIGVAANSVRFATPEDVLKAADQALYRAKSAGRNRISR